MSAGAPGFFERIATIVVRDPLAPESAAADRERFAKGWQQWVESLLVGEAVA